MTNPDYKFYIGLCDEFSEEIDYTFFKDFEIIRLSEIGLSYFKEITEKYDIIELNTCIKPSYFKYLISKNDNLSTIIYFDPDIKIFNLLDSIEKELETNDILLTPHILHPIGVDQLFPSENLFLNYGIYNLGFIALNAKNNNSIDLLNWWEDKTMKMGYNRVCEGLFVDQLWINLVPIFFDKVKVMKEYGFNVAPWNLHERNEIKKINNQYYMKDKSKLVFFHFSAYDFKNTKLLSKHYNRYLQINLTQEVFEIYSQYHQSLIKNNIENLSKVKCFLIKKPKINKGEKFKYFILNLFETIQNTFKK